MPHLISFLSFEVSPSSFLEAYQNDRKMLFKAWVVMSYQASGRIELSFCMCRYYPERFLAPCISRRIALECFANASRS
jgi:hypothetical protein